jgi:PAS domain S-box-containing protein
MAKKMVQSEAGSQKSAYSEALTPPFCGREALLTRFSADRALFSPSGDESAGAALERISSAFSTFRDGVWDWQPARDEVVCSPEYFGMLGYPAAETVINFEGWLELMHPEDRQQSRAVALACRSGCIDDFSLEFRLKNKDGSWRWILSRGSCLGRDEQGAALRIVGTHTSLRAHEPRNEELYRALEEKELLLKEVHHRIKNNMAMVQSMLSLQADMLEHSLEAKDALKAASGRVHSMMRLYAMIYEDEVGRDLPLDAFINSIVDDIFANAPNAPHIQLRKRLEALPISPKCLSSIGIVLNELITNAMKHAFPDGATGIVELEAYADQGTLRFSVRDDGKGLPEGRYARGFGLLMAESLVEQLGGRLRHESVGGTRFYFELAQNSCS